jgi:DNA-directed RNA polymerase subunit RPC12/RpoP
MDEDNKRFAIACRYCGSDEVSRDAWANWEVATQQWVLGATFDAAFCHRCEAETSLIEIELASAF